MFDWVRLCSIVELFDYRTFDCVRMAKCFWVRLSSITEPNRAIGFDWVRLPNVRLTTSGNMYRKELPVGDRVTEEPSSADDIGDQLSEYDSDSSNEEDSATHEEDAVEAVPVNFLSKTVRTRTGRQITLSYRALSSYWGTKSYFFLQKPLKTRVNSKYQSKGSTYILHLLAFVEIRLLDVFFWDERTHERRLKRFDHLHRQEVVE